MNDLDYLIAAIPFGRENAIGRDALSMKLCISDRRMRSLIEEARNRGLFIINDGNGKGYYQTTDIADIERCYKLDRAKALAILKRQKEMYKVLKEAGKL